MPNRFQILSTPDWPSAQPQVNRNFQMLDQENLTKTFNGPNGTKSIIQGRLPNGRYGQLYYDTNGTARILIGQAPDDGRIGIWVSPEGTDVLTQLGG